MIRYAIRVAGQLDPGWNNWFEGFTLTNGPDGFTTLSGPVIDQAALHGLLRRVGDLGVTLLSINILKDEAVTSNLLTRDCHCQPAGTDPR